MNQIIHHFSKARRARKNSTTLEVMWDCLDIIEKLNKTAQCELSESISQLRIPFQKFYGEEYQLTTYNFGLDWFLQVESKADPDDSKISKINLS